MHVQMCKQKVAEPLILHCALHYSGTRYPRQGSI